MSVARGDVRPGRRDERDLRAGLFEPRDPVTGEILTPALTHEDAPLDPRSMYAVSKLAQEQLVQVWAKRDGGAPRCSATTTCTVRACHATPRTPGSPRSSVRARARRRSPASSKTAVSGATSSTSTTSPPRTSRAIDGPRMPPLRPRARSTSGRGRSRRSSRSRSSCARAHGGPEPVVTGRVPCGRRASHHRVVRSRSRRTRAGRRRVALTDGMREFAVAAAARLSSGERLFAARAARSAGSDRSGSRRGRCAR